jgi:uncharacterized protein DUF4255
MALADTGRAIGAVTDALSQRLNDRTGIAVTVGRPEPDPTAPGRRLNLFLYEAHFDESLKNVPLDDGQRPPLWLVLRYLMTAFDDLKNSDSIQAYEYLGQGIRALQELSVLPLTPGLPAPIVEALSDNPEAVKITFDDAPVDLLSKVMQGADEKYRLSVAFQLRPIMIASGEVPSYSLLVGIDYTTTPATEIGEAGIHIPVIPSLGPTLETVSPSSFELNSTVTLTGTDLHLGNLIVNFGPVVFPITMQQPDRLQFVVRDDIATPDVISAGSHVISVGLQLPGGRVRSSNLLVGHLAPELNTASIFGAIQHVTTAPPPVGFSFATIDITGRLLGKDTDDFYLALFRDGETVKLFDALTDTSPVGSSQTARRFVMQKADAVPPGRYLVLFRVNGEQARQSPEIDLT